MGGLLSSCIEDMSAIERLHYDMTPIKTKSVPIIWLLGPPGAGRNTQARLLSNDLQFQHINVAQLIRDEIQTSSDRGKFIRDNLNQPTKKFIDPLIVDLIKEDMLARSRPAQGFIINNFPRTLKQAALFIKEIADVDVVVYLSPDYEVMVQRYKKKIIGELDDRSIRQKINNYTREIRDVVVKYADKLEKVISH